MEEKEKGTGGRSEIPEKERPCGRWNRRRGDVGGLAGGGRRAERPDAGLPDRRRHARAHPGARKATDGGKPADVHAGGAGLRRNHAADSFGNLVELSS